MRFILALLLPLLLVSPETVRAQGPTPTYAASIEQWRAKREADLKAETGWLALAGLFWLNEGANLAGADPSADVALPVGTAPLRVGVFERHGRDVRIRLEPGVTGTLNGRPARAGRLRADGGKGRPDLLQVGRLTMFVIQRGERIGIRLRDPEAPTRVGFHGLDWYPIDERFRIIARFVKYDTPKQIPVPNILGDTNDLPSPGYVEFTVGGRTLTLQPVLETPNAKELFYIMKDETAGDTTYGAGRFFYSAMPVNGSVEIDFNKAYSPPCAFTAFATCPLPPKGNQLPIRLEVGEKFSGHP